MYEYISAQIKRKSKLEYHYTNNRFQIGKMKKNKCYNDNTLQKSIVKFPAIH
jgi:hypothetical protein